MQTIRRTCTLLVLWCAVLSAQSDMKGHWTGALETPNGSIELQVDLDRNANGWIGSLSIPAQGAEGLPLDVISFADGKGSFRIKGAPGDPTFTGMLSADGKTLDGGLTMPAGTLPLKLNRTGDAKVDVPKASPAVAPEFVGTWEGKIEAGPGLRISLKISNGASGAEAVLMSLDQGNVAIPVSGITQKGTKLAVEVKAVSGGYDAEINPAGTELTGTWSQMGNSIALNLKKAAKP